MILFPEAGTLHRFTGYTADADGIVTGKAGETTEAIAGSFQPATQRQIPEDLMGEGIEKMLYIDTTLYTEPRPLDEANELPADEVTFGGQRYRVVKVEAYTTGHIHAEVYLTRRL